MDGRLILLRQNFFFFFLFFNKWHWEQHEGGKETDKKLPGKVCDNLSFLMTLLVTEGGEDLFFSGVAAGQVPTLRPANSPSPTLKKTTLIKPIRLPQRPESTRESSWEKKED